MPAGKNRKGSLIDGPRNARWQLVLGHGSGAPMDSDFMNAIARGLAQGGVRVVRFEFPYMAARRATGAVKPPDRAPVLQQAYRDAVAAHPPGTAQLAVGGKSLGGRVAAMVAAEVGARRLVCLGYPFHPPQSPEKSRLETLTAVPVPALVVQGTRDPFGTQDEVRGYALPGSVTVHWLPDGDHSFAPRRASGHTVDEHLAAAVTAVLAFLR